MKKVLLAYSSKTGNTERLSQYMYEYLKDDFDVDLKKQSEVKSFDYDYILVGMWVLKAGVDKNTLKFIDKIPNDKKVGVYGTCGGAHMHRRHEVLDKRIDEAFKNHDVIGVKLTYGKVDPKAQKLIDSIVGNLFPEKFKNELKELSANSREATEEEKREVAEYFKSRM
ncbi:MAG: flavodoxin family protein [Tissierellia bacterium]|nr:flavodoxin family protein [Tissierellia bacterium]